LARKLQGAGRIRFGEGLLMPTEIDDAALAFLVARSGLELSEAQKAELKTVYAGIAAMAERVRKPRGRMAEPAHIYNFTEEDLA